MTITVILHGVPNGNSVSDSKYITSCQLFYSRTKTGDIEFAVERKILEGKPLLFYTYLLNNVADNGNRIGSYFGLTVALDAYYAKLEYLYQIFNATLDKYIIGKVLQKKDKTYKFLIDDLRPYAEIAEDIKKFFVNAINMMAMKEDIHSVPEVNPIESQHYKLCWSDYSDTEAYELFQQYGALYLSSAYEMRREKELHQQFGQEKAKMLVDFQRDIQRQQEKFKIDLSSLSCKCTSLQKELLEEKSKKENYHKGEVKESHYKNEDLEESNSSKFWFLLSKARDVLMIILLCTILFILLSIKAKDSLAKNEERKTVNEQQINP